MVVRKYKGNSQNRTPSDGTVLSLRLLLRAIVGSKSKQVRKILQMFKNLWK